jgi:EAL domain-containing protein (putative c-di-GMP-specific phosphodiesterase class I)
LAEVLTPAAAAVGPQVLFKERKSSQQFASFFEANPTMISDPFPHQCEPVVSDWYLAGQLTPRDPAREFPIHASVFSVGRKPDNSLSIPSHSVSGYHAEFLQTEAGLIVRDLNSTNGTFVNGQRLEGEVQVHGGDLVQFATEVFRVGQSTRRNESRTVANDSSDQAMALVQFDRLINDGNAFPYYQPIVRLPDQACIGYEVLGRSRLFGLQMPAQMFLAAAQLNMEAELSEVFRMRGVQVGSDFPSGINLFLNTHPKELGPSRLHTSLRLLREADPNRRLTLEIHEGAVTNIDTIRELSVVLNDLNIQLAFDDFGVGEARLLELAEIRPDYLKFDMKPLRPSGRNWYRSLHACSMTWESIPWQRESKPRSAMRPSAKWDSNSPKVITMVVPRRFPVTCPTRPRKCLNQERFRTRGVHWAAEARPFPSRVSGLPHLPDSGLGCRKSVPERQPVRLGHPGSS